jgi:DNA-binding CsgD family transcriptional regulator
LHSKAYSAGFRMSSSHIQTLAIDSLFNSGMLGLGWADAKQILKAKRGRLAESLVLDQPLCKQVPALFGMESDIRQLRRRPEARLTLPRVAYMGNSGSPKMSIEVIWDDLSSGYVVLFHSDESLEKERVHVRRRRVQLITEENFHADVQSLNRNGAIIGELIGMISQRSDCGGCDSGENATGQANPFDKLTRREKDVVRLLIKGISNKLIAHALNISEKTVEAHRSHAIRRLGLRSSAELIRMAGESGFK